MVGGKKKTDYDSTISMTNAHYTEVNASISYEKNISR